LHLTTSLKEYKTWKPQTTSETILEQTAIVKNAATAEGAEAISATAIAVNGNDVYVSFHTYGATIKGAIDKATILEDGSIDVQNIKTYTSTAANPFEFNYITVASNGKIYAVGSISTTEDENGVAKVASETQTGTFDNGVIGVIDGTTLSTRKLYGGDGNGIILNGDYLQVASTYGLETYVADGLRREKAVATDGHAKSIVKSGSSVVVLSYDGNEAASTAYTDAAGNALTETGIALSSYASTDYTFETPAAISSISGVIVPTAGKNTVAVDNGVYYVAAGATGLLASNGNSFQVKRNDETQKIPAGYANSVAVDGSYVYVAYGAAGVYVLNKTDLSVVASYKNAGGKSANFVAVSNGKIFVAYGKDSWQVLQLATIAK
jgi:hypothetical protein